MRALPIWTLALVLLLGGLTCPLLRRRPVVVPLAQPLAQLACALIVLEWLLAGGWTAGVRLAALCAFVLVGCLLIWQSFGRRRWFVFRGGGFVRDPQTYDALALAIRQALQELRLPPATVICRRDGWLGLTPLPPEQQARLIAHLDDALADSKWQRVGLWQLFFGGLWAVLALALVLQLITESGGI